MDDLDNSVDLTETLLNSTLSCYYVVGFTHEGEAFHLVNARNDIEKYALDLLLQSAKAVTHDTLNPIAPVFHAEGSDTLWEDDDE